MKVKDILFRQKENEKIALIYGNERMSYRELYEAVTEHVDFLKEKRINRNIGVFIGNSIDYAKAYFTILFNDKIIIPIENNISKDMMCTIVEYCELSLIIVNNTSITSLYSMLEDFNIKVDIYNIETKEYITMNETQSYIMEGEENLDDVVIMLHTSGTTSNPKRVMLTNENLITNIESNVKSLGLVENDRCLIVLPMFFGYCNSSQFLSHLYVGASIVIYDSTFYPKKFLSIIDKEMCTNTTCVPSMLYMIVKNCEREKYNLSSLKYLCFGGGRVSIELIKKLFVFFDKTGIVQTYGQTEASPRVTCLLPEDAEYKIGSVGKPIPNVEVKIFDELDNEVEPEVIGEIVVRGKNVMKGYYKNPEITNEILRNGWLHTGDLGKFDNAGYLYIVGRIKNIIISGGLNIYPEEIEEVLISTGKVKDALVTAEQHNILGEIPVAKIVPLDGVITSQEELLKICMDKLPTNKIPRRIEICEKLEKTYTGKIKRIFESESSTK